MATPIEDYAVLGDTFTAALVSRGGSVDWLCLPRFDSPACFAALLGSPGNGRWLLGPSEPATSTRRYVGDSFVLETTHECSSGAVRVTDAMPLTDHRADLVRRIEGISGTVRMRHEYIVRFGYGKVQPWVTRHADGPDGSDGQEASDADDDEEVLTAVAGPDLLALRGTRLPTAEDGRHGDDFEVREGDVLTFSLTWAESHHEVPKPLDIDTALRRTRSRSEQWARSCDYVGPYRDSVVRSLLVLRLLTHGATGGIVAAATTSLPESFGGGRNWDYRYCWLRDASLTVSAMISLGYDQETLIWRNWLLRAVAGDPEDMQIMYAVDGARELPERTLDHLDGYAGSVPVRVGNGAVDQRQIDVLGEVMVALQMARDAGVEETRDSWALQRALVNQLADAWDQPDNGVWEIRGPLRRFTHSRVMVWAAFDRAIGGHENHGLHVPPAMVETWRRIRAQVHAEVLDKGFDRARGTFVQHYDTTEVDSSLLLIPTVGFLPGDDPRVLGTIRAIESDLMRDGLLLRYRSQSGVDGLSGEEHPFLACSFWLVTAYAMAGRLPDAEALMDRLVDGVTNDLGLMAEEFDPEHHRMAGNFPQAFSHLALSQAAVQLAKASGRQTGGGC